MSSLNGEARRIEREMAWSLETQRNLVPGEPTPRDREDAAFLREMMKKELAAAALRDAGATRSRKPLQPFEGLATYIPGFDGSGEPVTRIYGQRTPLPEAKWRSLGGPAVERDDQKIARLEAAVLGAQVEQTELRGTIETLTRRLSEMTLQRDAWQETAQQATDALRARVEPPIPSRGDVLCAAMRAQRLPDAYGK